MRELIYLSTAKLEQFDLSGQSRRRLRMRVETQLAVPGVGEVKLSPANRAEQSSKLEQVIAALERSDRAPVSFMTPSLFPGQWIRFSVPMYYWLANPDAVLFLDDNLLPGITDASQVRLMLHGSYRHVLGDLPRINLWKFYSTGHSSHHIFNLIEKIYQERALHPSQISYSLSHDETLRIWRKLDTAPRHQKSSLSRSLIAYEAQTKYPDDSIPRHIADELGIEWSDANVPTWGDVLELLYSDRFPRDPVSVDDAESFGIVTMQLDSSLPPNRSYTPMSGLARVTSILPYRKCLTPLPTQHRDDEQWVESGRLVLATPLFVEYGSPPPPIESYSSGTVPRSRSRKRSRKPS